MLRDRATLTKLSLWFYGFILLHAAIWTFFPSILRLNLPLDAMESTTWATHLAWGYDKNPFLIAWLSALALKIAPSGIMTYFLSQLSVIICFFAVWQLAKKMLPPLPALTSVLLLEGIQYYHLHAIDFSDNALELSFWALSTLFFYEALKKNRMRDWAFTGLFIGLGCMVKYYTVVLCVSMFLLLLKEYRHYFKKPGVYLSFFVFLLIILPHGIWAFSHDFITVQYALERTSTKHHWYIFPLQFTFEQFETLIPLFILLLLFIPLKKNHLVNKKDKSFLFFTGLMPFLLTLSLSAIFSMKLRAGWGQPLFSLWGIICIVWLNPVITLKKFYRFIGLLIFLMSISVTIYSVNLLRANTVSTAIFPGKTIAAFVEKKWENQYHTPLKFVAGGRWLAGNIALYSKDHPEVYIDWQSNVSPWIDEKKLKQQGGVFVWDLTTLNRRKELSYDEIKTRFPELLPAETYYFPWQRNSLLKPAEIKIAFLPPEL